MRDHRNEWQTREPDSVVVWRPASPPRLVEGPLALDFFADRTLVLELAESQVACREVGGRLQQIYLGGRHELSVGHGPGKVDPASLVYFVRTDVEVSWRWRERTVLEVATGGRSPASLPIRGACRLRIADPACFHAAVLQGLPAVDTTTLTRVLDTMVRNQLEVRLEPLGDRRGVDPLRAQVLLADLQAADLAEELAEIGLECVRLAVYTPAAQDEVPEPAPAAGPGIGSFDDVI
ncbi:MAG TPA: hypothetical protein PLL30_02495 [Candidatus Krumholzibacteria bacterium]|nr:hypothetical protein [Candidatus Krumholzibacteria bacterium]HPD70638.1 hypothetical protein [Candidatus Krumholzibacteria bacterium]HRY39662.1 hypothetical protein [Candidatus Krumholzibacteria bacterium]